MALAVTTYFAVKALHVMAVIAAYGLPLAYPMLLPYLRRRHPRAMPGIHDVQYRLNQRLTGVGTVLIIGFGVYLASNQHLWSKLWVQVPIGAMAAIVVLGGAIVVPSSRRMAELARADVESAPAGGAVAWGSEYERVYRRYMAIEVLLGVLVLTATFFMVAKP